MRGESYFIGMRDCGYYACVVGGGELLLLYAIHRNKDLSRYLTDEDFQGITDFNDLPNSLFACNVHQSVFEDVDSKVSFVEEITMHMGEPITQGIYAQPPISSYLTYLDMLFSKQYQENETNDIIEVN